MLRAILFYSTASLYPSPSIQTSCVSPFFFISRAEVVSSSSRDTNTRTHIHFFFRYSPLVTSQSFVRFITASISVSTALLAFLPRVLSLRAWHWLTPAVRFHFALLSIFLRPFLLFKLIFRLFYFSRRPPTSLSVYIKLFPSSTCLSTFTSRNQELTSSVAKGSIDFLSFAFAISKSIINYIKLCLFLK